MQGVTYYINDYEGPLDLLVQMIKDKNIDINDIPIVSICDQYMEFLAQAERMDMDIASEFLLMASELMLIKSRMLLPGRVDREDPRKELVDQLKLYMETKRAAEELRPLYEIYSGRMAKETDEIPPEKGAPLGLDPSLMTAALNAMLARLNAYQPEPRQMITPLLTTRMVSVEEKIQEIVTTLTDVGTASLFTLLKVSPDKADLLARFMGILELIKIHRILICSTVLDEAQETEENADFPSEESYQADATAGLSIAFILNPDYDPATDGAFVSEFENDIPNLPEAEETTNPDL